MSVPYRNRQLFSDHWLRERLPLHEDYALTPLGLAKLALWLRALPTPPTEASTAVGASGAAWDARTTLERVVAPCLALLGYGQQGNPGEWSATQLTLWSSSADLLWRQIALAATSAAASDALTEAPQTVLGVVPWNADLDAQPTGGARGQAPALLFLRRLAQSQAQWGILTNGRRWRLYARGAEPLEACYEVDLAELAASGAVDTLHYFWLFFAATAQLAPAAGKPAFSAGRPAREPRVRRAHRGRPAPARLRRHPRGVPVAGRCAGHRAWCRRRVSLARRPGRGLHRRARAALSPALRALCREPRPAAQPRSRLCR